MTQSHERPGRAVRGATRLGFEAVAGVTRIVEGMHANIAAGAPPLGVGTNGRTRGLTGLVYEAIRRVSSGASFGLDRALAGLDGLAAVQPTLPQPQWDALVSGLNGVLGDRLVEGRNPLAIRMQLRRDGRPAEFAGSDSPRRLLVLVHGLCMNDRQWHRDGHDHGESLARELGYTLLYLFYNTGRSVPDNGREFATLLEELVDTSPTAIEEITIVGHSMGGLVTRSAVQRAETDGLSWRRALRRIVFLGTPHHGAPLERIGHWVTGLADRSPYVAPLARLGMIRSAGITDLRHGRIVAEAGSTHDRFAHPDALPQPVPLPAGVACHAVAASLARGARRPRLDLVGDGLVPVASALGRHRDPARNLDFEPDDRFTVDGLGHIGLLGDREVYARIRSWLA
jgi:pimeloyl-ACP methyl ester carboxylesterase